MIRNFCALLFIVLIAPPLLADDPAAPPRFFIERIEVRNAKRVSTDVIIAESRLREGHEYSEEELRDASTRLGRLPFLLSADFSLEKGAERGRHVLVINVSETKPFFYSLDFRPILERKDNGSLNASNHVAGSESDGVVGVRFFVGKRGAIHLALVGRDFENEFVDDYSAFALGYTQYDLFNTRAFATLNLKRVIDGQGNGGITPQLVVGVPLSPNQTLTLGIDDTNNGSSERTLAGTPVRYEDSSRLINVAWTYNTTNHPFLPTRGTLLQVTPRIAWSDSLSHSIIVRSIDPRDVEVITSANHTRAYTLDLAAARYWELNERDSVSAGIEAGFGRLDIRASAFGNHSDDGQYGILRGGYSHSLWDRNRAKEGDSRLEVNLRLAKRSRDFADYRSDEYTEQISASWVRRSSWGMLRLGAGYEW